MILPIIPLFNVDFDFMFSGWNFSFNFLQHLDSVLQLSAGSVDLDKCFVKSITVTGAKYVNNAMSIALFTLLTDLKIFIVSLEKNSRF